MPIMSSFPGSDRTVVHEGLLAMKSINTFGPHTLCPCTRKIITTQYTDSIVLKSPTSCTAARPALDNPRGITSSSKLEFEGKKYGSVALGYLLLHSQTVLLLFVNETNAG